MKLVVILFILKLIDQSFTSGPGTVFVHLMSYQNPSGKTDKGVECDSWFNQFVQDKCDLVFSVCLKNGENNNPKYPCNIGYINTLNHVFRNTLRVKFGTNIGFIHNPINFTLSSMPETLNIGISVTDDDISGQETISNMHHHVSQLPIVNADEDIDDLNQIFLSSSSSEMILKIYGRCNANYYGAGCRQFCQPSMSRKTGFYACDRVTGQRHCLIGWTGNNCQHRDLCFLGNPCHGSASCTMIGSVVNCVCPESLTGQFCQIPKRPCDSSPCLNGGLCVQNSDPSLKLSSQTICICPRNFSGNHCQDDVDECDLSPCKNEAMCVNALGSYNCKCKNNHWGINCEKPPVYSVKSTDSAFLMKSSTARFMQNMIIVLLIAVICLICVIGLLSFLYYKNRSYVTHSPSVGSIYSVCHFDEKATHVTNFPSDEEAPYTNYYELETDNSHEDNLRKIIKGDVLKCYEKESVI